MKVTNLNGTSDNACSCGSWLKHWERFNYARQSKPTICPACGRNFTEVGAHVKKYQIRTIEQFIQLQMVGEIKKMVQTALKKSIRLNKRR